jgi:hypothetical protein
MKQKEARDAARAAGVSIFNVGQACKRGHLNGRYVSDGCCVGCRQDRYRKNGDAISESGKIAYRENKEIFSERHKAYREKNKDYLTEKDRAYREANKEVLADKRKKLYETEPERLKIINSRARAKRNKRLMNWGEEQNVSIQVRERELYSMADQLARDIASEYEVDHMYPLLGKLVCGLHVAGNLQLIPRTLNAQKRNKFVLTEPHEWMLYMTGRPLREPDWCAEAEAFYRGIGWDFRRGCYGEKQLR